MTSGAVTADGPACVLADGSQMPMLGPGVRQAPNGPEGWASPGPSDSDAPHRQSAR